jgi:hypothetical protein
VLGDAAKLSELFGERGLEGRKRLSHSSAICDLRFAIRRQIGCNIEAPQLWHFTSCVLDIRAIVEWAPQLGQPERSSKRRRQLTQR